MSATTTATTRVVPGTPLLGAVSFSITLVATSAAPVAHARDSEAHVTPRDLVDHAELGRVPTALALVVSAVTLLVATRWVRASSASCRVRDALALALAVVALGLACVVLPSLSSSVLSMRSDLPHQRSQTHDAAHVSALDTIYCHARAVDICTSRDQSQSLADMFGTHDEPPAAESWTAWRASSHMHTRVFERAFRGCQRVFAACTRRHDGTRHDAPLASCLLRSVVNSDVDAAQTAAVDAWCGSLFTNPSESSAARAASGRLAPSSAFRDAFTECEREWERTWFVPVTVLVSCAFGIALVLEIVLARRSSLGGRCGADASSSSRDPKRPSASALQDQLRVDDQSAHDTRVREQRRACTALDDPIAALSARTFVRVSEDDEFHFVKCHAADTALERPSD